MTFVIVGAGLAGQRAAETLRSEGFAGRIVLLGAEPERPYDRPPLSKEVLQKEAEPDLYFRPSDWYAEQRIEFRPVAAAALDPGARVVTLANGERLGYDALLCATGTRVRRLGVPGADLDGVFYLRTLADARRIRAAMAGARRVVVVGGGFIGAEVAASCRARGLEVTLIESLPVPLGRVLGEELGRIYAGIHRERGVNLYTGETVAEFQGAGRVERVVTGSGRVCECDFAVVGIGVVPEVEWLAGSGVRIDNGIVVNEYCETNVPGVYAAGDVARWPYRGELLRVEHWDNAGNQAAVAARNMLGKGERYNPVLYFWSDQYDLRLQYVGHASTWDRIVYRGSVPARNFTAFFTRDGQVHASLSINRPREMMLCRRLIQSGKPVDLDRLGDEGVDLKLLL